MGKSELFLSIPQILNTALLIVLLTVEGIWDWKTRRIRMDAVLLCAAAGICLRIADRMTVCSARYDGPSLLASFLPGAVLLLLAVLGRGIGSGDAALFLTAGLLWGQETAELAFFTFLLAAAVGLILHFFRHLGWKDSVPMAPFMLISGVGIVIAQLLQAAVPE